jgi:16S rRNA processing protein RimM
MVERAAHSAWVCVAKVVGAHGLRGALKLRCFTENPEDVAAYGPLYDDQGDRRFSSLKILGPTRGGVLVAAAGIADRTAAEALRGLELFVPRAALPVVGPDEFYRADLAGLAALRADGSRLGTVRGLDNFGAGDVIEIAAEDGRLLTLPFDRRTVPEIDLAGGRLVVEPPAELAAEAPR